MKAEKYLLKYMTQSNMNLEDVRNDLGFDVTKLRENEELLAFTNNDYAGDVEDLKSTSGFVFFIFLVLEQFHGLPKSSQN